VVVLVDVTINGASMKEAVERSVEQIVDAEEQRKSNNRVENGHVLKSPVDTVARRVPAVLKEVIVEAGSTHLVGPDINPVDHAAIPNEGTTRGDTGTRRGLQKENDPAKDFQSNGVSNEEHDCLHPSPIGE
jgi:hypothetical protein